MGGVNEELREYEALEDLYRLRLAEATAAHDEHEEQVAKLVLERCRIQKRILEMPPGVARSMLTIRECDLAAETFQIQIDLCRARGEELSADIKSPALRRALQQRTEAEGLLETQPMTEETDS